MPKKIQLFALSIVPYVFILGTLLPDLAGAATVVDPEFPHINFELTDAERRWLRSHKTIKAPAARDFHLEPIYMVDTQGRFVGMGVDLAEYIAQRLALDLRWVRYDDINDTLRAVLNHDVDIITFMGENMPGINDQWTLTDYFQTFPSMVVVSKSVTGRVTMDDLKGKRVASVRLWPEYRYLVEHFPELEVQSVERVDEGLRAVAFGEIDAFICILPVVAYHIQDMGITTLRVAGQMDKVFRAGCGVRSDWPEFHSLVDKVLATMTVEEKDALLSKWIPVLVPDEVDYRHLMTWLVPTLGFMFFIIIAFIYWTRRLTRANAAERLAREEAISATKKMERAVKEEQELRKKQVRFVDMLSHEYRTPAAVIQANLDLMEMKFLKGEPKMTPHLEKMQKAIERLTELFSAGLDKGDIKGGRVALSRSIFDLRDCLADALDHIRALWPERNIDVSADARQTFLVEGDPILLKTVLLNLLENALKYSPEASGVHVVVDHMEDAVTIRVRDKGIGIPEKDMRRVFEKYYRADNGVETSGTGVGLFLVKRAVELHEGTIELESVEGVGTTISITLPEANVQRSEQ